MDLSKGNIEGGTDNIVPMMRDHRKGNWTLQETMVLIEAKKMDDERRMKRLWGDGGERGKPTEPRWKWVEDYCWNSGCLRSQSQCNDKWDNLMRDFKRVREYEIRRLAEKDEEKKYYSYWGMEKNQRKENNLPPNMLSQTYDALVEVVERKCPTAAAAAAVMSGGGGGAGGSSALMLLTFPSSQTLPSVDSDTSEYSDSPAKRKKTRSTLEEVSCAISKSATMIAEAIQACEEREEKRHKKVVSLHETRLRIEESKVETNRQSINGLVDAINKLANSILALAANSHHKNQPNTSK
ncbi:uncharacterized protein [Henckelia pumila]|uniref:uncharacterized protein n=1 Tax=Henckelia pumila TaxID=405737 RepID=UPI003C6E8A92